MIKDMTDEGFEKAYQILLKEAEEHGATIAPSEDGRGHLYINGEEANIEKVFEEFFGKDNDKDINVPCKTNADRIRSMTDEELNRRIDRAIELYNRNVEKSAMYEALAGISPEPQKEETCTKN